MKAGLAVFGLLKHFLTDPFDLLWRHRRLLKQTVRSDLKSRFAGSVFGWLWLVLLPLLFLGAYSAVFLFVLQTRFAGAFSGTDHILLIFCGLVPFLGFAETLAAGVPSVTSNASLLKNTLFPIDLAPVKSVLTAQCSQIVGTSLLFLLMGFLGKLRPFAMMIPAVWALQVLFSLGVIWFLSSLNVYLRDLQNVVSILILILQMISPIVYTVDMVPEGIRPLLGINPLYYIIAGYQDCLLLGRFPRTLLPLAGIALGSFWIGYWFFRRLKRVFTDNV